MARPCSSTAMRGLATMVRAALPAVPVVNLLPGIRKTGAATSTGLAVTPRRRSRSSATHVDGVRRGLRLPGQGHRAAALPAHARRSRCTWR